MAQYDFFTTANRKSDGGGEDEKCMLHVFRASTCIEVVFHDAFVCLFFSDLVGESR